MSSHEFRPIVLPLVKRCEDISNLFGSTPLLEEDDVTATSYAINIRNPENDVARSRGLNEFRVSFNKRSKLRLMVQAKRDSHLHKLLEQIPCFGKSHDKQKTPMGYVFWAWCGKERVNHSLGVLEHIAAVIK